MTKLILSLFISSVVMRAMAEECEHRVIFIPQRHADYLTAHGNFDDRTTISEFFIGRYLIDHKDTPVFAEGYGEDLSLKNAQCGSTCLEDQRVFPKGLPQEFDQLTPEQSKRLSEHGAEEILVTSGQIDTIHRVAIDAKTLMRDWSVAQKYEAVHAPLKIGSPYYNLTYTNRERMALGLIKDFWKENSSRREVIIIFGATHDFNRYPDLFDPKCVTIPNEFLGEYVRAHTLMSQIFQSADGPRAPLGPPVSSSPSDSTVDSDIGVHAVQ